MTDTAVPWRPGSVMKPLRGGGSWLRVAIELSDFDSDELAAAWGQNIQRPSSDSDSDLVADFHPSLNGSCHEPCCLWGPE